MPAPTHPLTTPLAVIGGGNMAQAILEGAVAAGVIDPRRVVVAEPVADKHAPLARLGVRMVSSAQGAIDHLRRLEVAASNEPGQLLLAVKPQMLSQVGGELTGSLADRRRVVITILAGTPTHKVRTALGPACAVVRAMPNTPARVRKGVTAVALGDGATSGDESLANRLFAAVGPVVITTTESMMDAYTAVASSGPAYVFYLAECMVRAAIDLGFDPPTADTVVRATLSGAAELLQQSDQSPAQLRADVTSKGGTTEAATKVLDENQAHATIVLAIKAACTRAAELSLLS